MPAGSFTLGAVIWNGRVRHHRLRDHTGVETDLVVTLSERIGPWEVDTPIRFVLEDLFARISAFETADRHFGSFSLNAYIPDTRLVLEATIKRTQSSTFTLGGWVVGGASFALSAWVRGGSSFTLSATIV